MHIPDRQHTGLCTHAHLRPPTHQPAHANTHIDTHISPLEMPPHREQVQNRASSATQILTASEQTPANKDVFRAPRART